MPEAQSPLPGRLAEALHAALDALDEAGADYAVLGGIAVNLYGLPRLTMDIDIVTRVSRVGWPRLLDGLDRRGFRYARPGGPQRDQREALEDLARDSMTQMWHGGFRLDLLQASDPLHMEALARKDKVTFLSRTVPVLRPEHLLLTKWIAGRPKDLLDVDSILASQGKSLDLSIVRAWLPAIERSGGLAVGEFEARVQRWLGQP